MRGKKGFSLIEVLVYTAIFAVSSIFLVGILGTITRIQTRQASFNEVNQQLSFAGAAIQRLVQESSLIDIPTNTATSTLVLRAASSASDPVKIYASSGILYLAEGATIVPLTDSNVNVDSFIATKYEDPGGLAIAQIDLSLSYNTSNPQARATRILKKAITRISAATFDSSVNPNSDNNLDLGTASLRWKNAYFAADVQIDGKTGLGTTPSASAKLRSTGDIGFTTSTVGFILMAPNGNCYRVTINSSLQLATSTAACP